MSVKTTLATALLSSAALLLCSCANDNSRGRKGTKGGRKRASERFAKNDLNGDGQLDYNEFLKSPMAERADDANAAFKCINQNGDCILYTSPSPRDRG